MPSTKKSARKKNAAPKKASRKPAIRKSAAKKSAARKSAPKKTQTKSATRKKSAPKKWSGKVTKTSDAMDLKAHIFESNDPREIAASIKRSAESSKRKKGTPFQSAMSMINFYENRAGKNLSAEHRKIIDQSKEELRKLFGREEE